MAHRAAVTLTEIEDKLGAEFPMLNDMLRVFGSRQIRNRATMAATSHRLAHRRQRAGAAGFGCESGVG